MNKAIIVKLLCVLALGWSSAPVTLAAGPAASADLPPRAYLPLVLDTRPAITGSVTVAGVPAAGVPLELLFDDGQGPTPNPVLLQTTVTAANGSFRFPNPPALPPQVVRPPAYWVRFDNAAETPGRLKLWQSYIFAYDGQQLLDLGALEIGDVAFTLPAADATVTLPAEFAWTPRVTTPGDSYDLRLVAGDNVSFTAPDLGYVAGYTLTGPLPGVLEYGVPLQWWVEFDNGAGYGVSRLSRTVTFTDTAAASGPAILRPLVAR